MREKKRTGGWLLDAEGSFAVAYKPRFIVGN
jgi:hypothetical protein